MPEPETLISTEQLAAALGQPDLRIYNSTTYLQPPQRPVDRRLGYSLRRTDIYMKATTEEKGISHGATSTCISA
jgi:hypothetical protein